MSHHVTLSLSSNHNHHTNDATDSQSNNDSTRTATGHEQTQAMTTTMSKPHAPSANNHPQPTQACHRQEMLTTATHERRLPTMTQNAPDCPQRRQPLTSGPTNEDGAFASSDVDPATTTFDRQWPPPPSTHIDKCAPSPPKTHGPPMARTIMKTSRALTNTNGDHSPRPPHTTPLPPHSIDNGHHHHPLTLMSVHHHCSQPTAHQWQEQL